MKLAILHYHLRPGGVTTVIRNAQRALAGRHDVKILADYGYDERPARSQAEFLAGANMLLSRLTEHIHGVDVVHTHNVGLGKHPRLTCAIKLLAERTDIKVINQVHDFPEDNRAAALRALRYCTGTRNDNFWRAMCYYDLPNVLWATLTTHDAAKLASRGVPSEKIRVLPNPVDDEFFTQPAPSKVELREIKGKLAAFARANRFHFDPRKKLLLSPMKVMVRKNNEEAVDLVRRLNAQRRGEATAPYRGFGRAGWLSPPSEMASREYQLVISLDASSTTDRAYSERLKRKIRRERLPVVIGVGAELDNPLPLFHLAHAILTTSKAEGFGYTFVEGWLCRKPVIGRDIPEVTQDFVSAGMKMDHFYREFDDEAVSRTQTFLAHPPPALIEHNRRVVLKKYSLATYARRYGKLLAAFHRRTGVPPV